MSKRYKGCPAGTPELTGEDLEFDKARKWLLWEGRKVDGHKLKLAIGVAAAELPGGRREAILRAYRARADAGRPA